MNEWMTETKTHGCSIEYSAMFWKFRQLAKKPGWVWKRKNFWWTVQGQLCNAEFDMLQFAVVWHWEVMLEGRKTGSCVMHSGLYRGPYAKGVVPWGRENGKCFWDIDWCVLLWGSEVCSVQRLKWQQLVRMCARKEQRARCYSFDCELFVGLRSLKFGVLVYSGTLQWWCCHWLQYRGHTGLEPWWKYGNMKTVDFVLSHF